MDEQAEVQEPAEFPRDIQSLSGPGCFSGLATVEGLNPAVPTMIPHSFGSSR